MSKPSFGERATEPDHIEAKPEMRSARQVCPKCTRKGVGYAPHPHAFGYKSYNRAVCRYCRAWFLILRR